MALGIAFGCTGGGEALAQGELRRGDANNDGELSITDGIFVLNYLFIGGTPPVCLPIANANGDDTLDITDGVFILGHLFLGTAEPPPLTAADLAECRGGDPEAIARGMVIYQEPDPDGNFFSCAVCHSLGPDPAPGDLMETLRPGHTLLNVLGRPSYKGEARGDFLGATNVCRVDWMATRAWQGDRREFLDLVAFLESVQTADSSPALVYEIVAPARTGPSTADPVAGCKLFNRSCFICHGEGAAGSQIGPELLAPALLALEDPDYIRMRIRLSGPNPTDVYKVPAGFELFGSYMPFWTKDKLSDAEVEELVAFIAKARQAKKDGLPAFACPVDPGGGNAVRRGVIDGRYGTGQNPQRFPTTFHGVAGTIEELDTRKIRLTGFNYDGGGIIVKVYLFKGPGGLGQGFSIGPDLFRPGEPYVNAAITVDIPPAITADMYDHASIWCVSAKQDFGSARLAAPPPPAAAGE